MIKFDFTDSQETGQLSKAITKQTASAKAETLGLPVGAPIGENENGADDKIPTFAFTQDKPNNLGFILIAFVIVYFLIKR